MIGTGAAILGAAALGLGGSLYAGSQAKEAAGVQAQASREGSQAQIQALLMAQGFTRENAERAAAEIRGAFPAAHGAVTSALPNALAAVQGARPGVENALATARGSVATGLKPYIDTGHKATYTLASLYGLNNDGRVQPNALEMIRNSPDYQFAQTEGMNALENSNAARGLLQSSQHLRSAQQFGQNLATNQFGNYVGRLQALSGQGAAASNVMANADLSTGNSLAQYLQSLGINTANLYTNQGNTLANMWNNYGGALANVWTGQGNALAQSQGQIGQAANAGITGAGQAEASGVVGGANAVSSGLSGVGNNLMQWMQYQQLQQMMAGRPAVSGGGAAP